MKIIYLVHDESSGPVGYYSTKERAEEGAKEYFNRLEFSEGDEQTFEEAWGVWLFMTEERLDQ
jgi:hypothetical protein